MPAAVVAIAASFAGSYIAAAIGLTGLAATIVGGVIAMGISHIGSTLLGLNERPSAGSAGDSGILINDASPVSPLFVVYGERRVGVNRVFIKTTDNNQYLHLVLTLAEGEIESVEKIYLNGEEAWIKTAGTSGTVQGKFAGNAEFYIHLGADNQTVDTTLKSRINDTAVWSDDHRLRGIAYMYVRLKYNREVFQGVPNFQALIRGIKPPSGFTSTSPKSSYPASTMPPRVLFDYLTNTRYGKGIPVSMIDSDSFTEALNYCDDTLYQTSGDSGTQAFERYTCHIGLDPDETLFNNVKKILSTMNAFLVFSGGKYRLKLNRTGSSVFEFNKENIIGRWDITLGSKATKYNRIKVNYQDYENDYQPNIIYVDSPTYRTQDNGNVLEREIDLPGTTRYIRAYYIGLIVLNQSRYQTSVSFTAAPTAFNLDIGDVVTVTHDTPGWTDKKFRVMGMALLPDGNCRMTLIEYDDNIFTYTTIPSRVDPATLDPGINYSVVPAPTSLSVTQSTVTDTTGSVKAYIDASWTAPTAPGYIAFYEFQYKLSSDANYTTITTTQTNAKVGPLANGTYNTRVYAVNQYGARSSALT